MDNVTHSLFALTLARTPLSRAGRGTTAALLLASNAPDIDIVATASGAVSYLHWHRGPTHGPIGLVALSIVTAAIVWSAQRLRQGIGIPAGSERPLEGSANQRASFAMLVAVSLVGAICHVLMDLPTVYGTRLLSPFSWRWFSIDLMPIVDIYLLVILLAGVFLGLRSPSVRHRSAMIVLVLMAANYGIRFVSHRQALAIGPRLLGPGLPERCEPQPPATVIDAWPRQPLPNPPASGRRCLVEMMAIPSFISPFHWVIVAQMSNGYEFRDVDVLDPRTRGSADDLQSFWRLGWRQSNIWTPMALKAADTGIGRIFLGFSRLPASRTTVDRSGLTTVQWDDMRFMILPPGRSRRSSLFTAIVRIAPDGTIVEQKLGP